MDCITLRPWTPRTQLRARTPEPDESTLCKRTIAVLKPLILNAIKPFPEAHRAMSQALMPFIVPQAAT